MLSCGAKQPSRWRMMLTMDEKLTRTPTRRMMLTINEGASQVAGGGRG